MKIERTRNHFLATFSLPSPSSDLKVPIIDPRPPAQGVGMGKEEKTSLFLFLARSTMLSNKTKRKTKQRLCAGKDEVSGHTRRRSGRIC